MNSVTTPIGHTRGQELQQGRLVITPQHMQGTEALKQWSQRSAVATANLSASLALAATLCSDAGANADDAAIALLVGAVAAAEIEGAYADLTHDDSHEDMYEVQYAEPLAIPLSQATFAFETVLENFTTGLLQLNSILRLVHLSYERLHDTMDALENNRTAPESALFLDAQLFSTLQRQALWRNLQLCTQLHNDLLLLTPCINLLWHQFRLRIPSHRHFAIDDVSETLTTLWQVRAQDMVKYHLSASGITSYTGMLHILRQRGTTLSDPLLLVSEEWHKSMYLLTQSFQQALDTFYVSDTLPALNDNPSD
jgi:hypothetical protein